MSENERIAEVANDMLTESLTSREVKLARKFLESCSCTSTKALRALMAVMCELDQVHEAEVLEAALPSIALIEAVSL